MELQETYVGIDVAKARVDVAVCPADEVWGVTNDEAGIRQLVSQLKALEPALVLLEASGGLELPLVAALAAESPDGTAVIQKAAHPLGVSGSLRCQLLG